MGATAPLDPFHAEIGPAVLLANFVEGDDVRMVELRGGRGLGAEALQLPRRGPLSAQGLYTLIRNKALNLIRQKVRHPVRLAGAMEMDEVADRAPGPAEQWEACWDRELMHLLLAELEKKVSPVNHRLLILRWIEDRPLAEVAQLLKLSEKQVTYRQQRLFRKLRAARALYRGEPFGATAGGSTSGR